MWLPHQLKDSTLDFNFSLCSGRFQLTASMPQQQLEFVSFDSSQASSQAVKRVGGQCQICFEQFATSKALRDHVGHFQLETQQLLARLLEVQAHLPQTDTEDSGSDEDDGDEDEDEDEVEDDGNKPNGDSAMGYGVGSSTASRPGRDQIRHQCPYPNCCRKTAFKTRRDLAVHYQKHVRCNEICVFCRTSFMRVRKYIRHKCQTRQKKQKSKDFYRKERRTQLRNFTNRKLDTMLAQQASLLQGREETSKRHITDTACSDPSQAQKRSKTIGNDAKHTLPMQGQLPGNIPLSSLADMYPATSIPFEPTQLASPPDPFNNPAMSSNHASNQGFSFSFPHNVDTSSNFTPGGMIAPIFHGVTIPPFYHMQQPGIFPLVSDIAPGRYSEAHQLETPNISPSLVTEDHAEVEQIVDGIGRALR